MQNDEIAKLVAEFKAKGNRIKVCKPGERKVETFRRPWGARAKGAKKVNLSNKYYGIND